VGKGINVSFFFLYVYVMFFYLDVEVFVDSKDVSASAGYSSIFLENVLFDNTVFPAANK